MGSLVTLTVLGGSMLAGGNPDNTWWTIAVLYLIGLGVGLVNGLVVTLLKVPSIIADARHAALAQRRGADVVGRGAARLSAGEFPRARPASSTAMCR